MSEVIRVIDLSEWTGPVPVANAIRMAEEWHIEGVILQAWGGGGVPGRRNEYFHQAVDSFRAVGIDKIDPYVWPPREWREALDWIGDYKRFMAGALYLDVEAGEGVNDSIVNGVRQAGWEPRIYASPSGWYTIMRNTDRYSDLKLWLARYLLRFRKPDGFYVPGFDARFPYDAMGNTQIGGWVLEDLVGWQTTGTVPDFCGESIDSSLFWASAFEREGNDDMAVDEQLRAIVKDLKETVQEHGDAISALEDLTDAHIAEAARMQAAIDRLEAVSHDAVDGAAELGTHEDNPDAHHA